MSSLSKAEEHGQSYHRKRKKIRMIVFARRFRLKRTKDENGTGKRDGPMFAVEDNSAQSC
jgi:hypothetical protein